MNDTGNSGTTRPVAEEGRVTLLKQGLWKALGKADDIENAAEAWSPLMFEQLDFAEAVCVFVTDPEGGRLRTISNWPKARMPGGTLVGAAEAAVENNRGVVRGGVGDAGSLTGGLVSVATPLVVDGKVLGAVGAEISPQAEADLKVEMRRLQWGAAWMRDLLRQDVSSTDKRRHAHAVEALNTMVSVAEQTDIATATRAAATALATRFDCDRVTIGFRRFFHTRVFAISHSAQFSKQMNLVRLLGAAMDEAIDQRGVVIWPETRSDDPRATHRHEKLAHAQAAGHIVTTPLYCRGHFTGAVTFERPVERPFSQDEVEILEAVSTVLAPVLDEKRRNDRWLLTKLGESIGQHFVRLAGPGYLGRKALLVAVAALVAFFWFATGENRIAADAMIEGAVQRTIAAPADGFIAESLARPGDVVSKGEVLVRLDDRELTLERLRLMTELQRGRIEYDRALAQRDRAETQVRRSQIEQTEAQISLVDKQIERTRMTAPYDGIVTSGDLSQSIGAAVARGEALLTVAPIDAYRVILSVDERRISDVTHGQSGTLVVTSLPERSFPLAVRKITPVAEYADGATSFRVEAELTDGFDGILPGMEGVGKIDVAQARLINIWTRPMVDWVRLWAWRWLNLG